MTLFETEYIGNNRCNVYLCGVCIASYKIKNPYSPKAAAPVIIWTRRIKNSRIRRYKYRKK